MKLKLVIDMATRETQIEGAERQAYSDEVLCANWTPALELVRHERVPARLPVAPEVLDVDAFLGRMYAYQQA